jgi:hypothetical protein
VLVPYLPPTIGIPLAVVQELRGHPLCAEQPTTLA